MKKRWRALRRFILAPVAYCLARLVGMTLRIQAEGYERYEDVDGGVIFSGWHGRTFVAANFFRNQGIWTIISHSHDGEIQNGIFKRFGFNTIRGSTGRGGARAAAQSIRVLKKGGTMAFTPDGPRGPTGVVQPGVIVLAKKSGAALVPVGVSADRRWLVSTWDRYMVPKPFARCVMLCGDPIYVPKRATDEESEQARLQLEHAIRKVQTDADARMGHRDDAP